MPARAQAERVVILHHPLFILPTSAVLLDLSVSLLGYEALFRWILCEPTKSRWGQRTVTSGRWLNGLGVERRDRQLAAAAVSAGLADLVWHP